MSDDQLAETVEAVLGRVPLRWEPLDRDDLTAVEDRALQTLVARGLVDLRAGGRISITGDPRPFRFRVEFTGEGGLPQAMEPVLRAVVAAVGEAHPAMAMTPESGYEWRLGEHGQQAVADLQRGSPQARRFALDFILSRNLDRMAAARLLNGGNPAEVHQPIAGSGRLLKLEREPESVPNDKAVPVRIDNPEAIAAALASLLARATTPAPPAVEPDAEPKSKGGRPARVREAVDKYLDSHKELLLPDRLGRPPRQEDWADLIARDIERFQRQKVSPHTVRDQLKGRWSFANVRILGAQWSVKPERQA